MPPTQTREIPAELLRAAAGRVLDSPALQRAPQLTKLFRFVTDAAIANPDVSLSEYDIGVGARIRPAGYSPNEDNIVRVLARTLRQKLESYYSTEGANDEFRIVIPKGSYIPEFLPLEPQPPALAAEAAAVGRVGVDPPPARRSSPARRWFALAAVMIALSMAALGYWARPWQTPAERFWHGFLPSGQPVVFVPTDVSLVVMQDLAGRWIPLSRYAGRDYWHDFTGLRPEHQELNQQLGKRRITSLTSMKAGILLAHKAQAAGARLVQQYARDARADEIDRQQLFLVGAAHADPWVEVFTSQNSFQLRLRDREFVVQNLDARPGERAEYRTSVSNPVAYGLISCGASQATGRDILVAQGTGSAGTEAALEFLFDDARMNKFLAGLERRPGTPHFELLLESVSIAGTAPSARILAYRQH